MAKPKQQQLFDLYADSSGSKDFDEHYTDPIPASEIKLYDKYKVGNVTWLGTKGRMYKATPDMTSPREDNIFHQSKLEAVVSAIESGRRIITPASLAYIMMVDRDLVEETQEAHRNDRLWEYAITRPFSIRDIGKYWVKIRDGNHRIFGAFLAGAPYAWVNVLGRPDDDFPAGLLK